MDVLDIIKRNEFNRDDLLYLLSCSDNEEKVLFKESENLRNKVIGNKVFLRGLIELSNVCEKDCFYCGIRKSNIKSKRYNLEDNQVVEAAIFAYKKGYGSIAIQSGEISNSHFSERIARLLEVIHRQTNYELGVTLSLGEQSKETYRLWRNAGAHRYLLRIESSTPQLYSLLHPSDKMHSFKTRVECLQMLKDVGYQVGTGVMIGLPFQKLDHLVNDLLFLKQIDIDMCGMGPFLEHNQTPLFQYKESLITKENRLKLSLHMLASLRLIMPTINIAATTALQAIDPQGREKAIRIAANVIMPNITPGNFREDYALYQGKPNTIGDVDKNTSDKERPSIGGSEIVYFQQGNSKHYFNRKDV